MPVHLYGNPAEMSKIMSFANENNLSVIEVVSYWSDLQQSKSWIIW